MALDRSTFQQLKRYAQAFKEAYERGANESDTVMYLVKFFEDVLGYDSLAGDISKEICIKGRYCDFGIKLGGTFRLIIEAKAAGNKELRPKDIEQAEGYASRSGIRWVLLTNGVSWQLYHLTFNEGEGINHDLAAEVNLVEAIETNTDQVSSFFEMLSKAAVLSNALDDFWLQKKALAPASIVRALFSEPVLSVLRRELNRNAEARLEMADVFTAVKDALSKDALLAAGDITLSKRRKRRRKVKRMDAATGQETEVEVETDEDEDGVEAPASSPVPTTHAPTAAATPLPVPPPAAQ
jgi:predicted type IV restriction endonuclease